MAKTSYSITVGTTSTTIAPDVNQAVATEWASGAYVVGDFVKNSDGRRYWATTAGDSLTGPTHTRAIEADPSVATSGILAGSSVDVETTIATWQAITDGEFIINTSTLGGLDFSALTTMAEIGAYLDGELDSGGIDCEWDGSKFIFTTQATGVLATMSFITDPSAIGTYIGDLLACESTSTGATTTQGVDASDGVEWMFIDGTRSDLVISADITATTYIADDGDAISGTGLILDANRPAVSYDNFSGRVEGIVASGTSTITVKFQA